MALTKISRSLLDTGVSDSSDATAITIDSSENIGIGTTSPATTLDVTSSSDEAVYLRSTHATTTNVFITNTNATTGNTAGLVFAPANNITGATIKCEAKEDFSTSANRTADLLFLTRKDGTLSEKMRIDSSGNVGIGITPTTKLDLEIDTDKRLTFSGSISEIGSVAGFQSINSAGSALGGFGIRADTIRFATGSSERMRIHSSGCVSIGNTVDATNSFSRFSGSSSKYSILMNNNYGGGTAMFAGNTANSGWIFSRFYTNGSQVAYISVSTTGASLVSPGSDLSLKENIEDWNENVLNKFKDIKPVTFNFISDEAKKEQKGYIAQNEVEKFPEAYPFDTETNKYYFNPSEMTVYLMKAIQELSAKVEELESKINE